MPRSCSRFVTGYSFAELKEMQSFDSTPDENDRIYFTFLAKEQIRPDADGYYPPKYLINDNEIDQLLYDALFPLNLHDAFTTAGYLDSDDVDLQDFVVAELYENPNVALDDCIRTLVTIRVEKREDLDYFDET